MKRFALLAIPFLAMFSLGCTGEQGPRGPQGEEGPSADASINAVIPSKVFLARMVDVTVSGFNTNWTDAAKLDFGPDVVVLNQTLASSTAIVATIEVDAKAAPGPRDVQVVDAGGTVTYKGAFKLESPLDLELTGTGAQGSILIGKAKQKDLSTPFDMTSTGDGFFEPIVYTNINIAGSLGIGASVEAVDMYSVDMLVFTDVDTPAGKADFTVNSGPLGDALPSPAPGALDVVARMPEPLAEGVGSKGSIDAPFATLLYSFAPSGAGVYSLEATSSSADSNPGFALLPKSGRFAQILGYGGRQTIIATNTDPFYAIYWDNSGMSGYVATMKADKVMTADVDPNDTCANAQAAGALPADVKNMYLSNQDDVDWISFDVAPGDVGKIVHVTTVAGDPQTDTVVEVLAANCTTSLGASADEGYHEDFKSDPITAPGKHFVKVTNSSFGYTGVLYDLTIALETP